MPSVSETLLETYFICVFTIIQYPSLLFDLALVAFAPLWSVGSAAKLN